MPKESTPTLIIKYEGLFDFEAVYAAIIDWGKSHGYMWHEQDFTHKVPKPEGAEQKLKWHMYKKVNEFMHYHINFAGHIWDLTEVEVDAGGKKKTLTNARMYIKMTGTMEWDWQKRFTGSRFAKKLGEWWTEMRMKEISSVYYDTLHYRLHDLQSIIKQVLEMQSKKHMYKGYMGDS